MIAFFHGGGFIAGDLDSHDGLCRELAAAARAVLVAVAYRLAPETPFPGGLEDAYDATTWLAASAPELGADSRRLGVAGDSAGANLATGVAMLAPSRSVGVDRLSAAAVPQARLREHLPVTRGEPSAGDSARSQRSSSTTATCPTVPAGRDPLASPVLAADLAGMPPGLIVSADGDTLRDEAEAYGQALRQAGASVATLRAIGLPHGFASMTELVPSAPFTGRSVARFP